MRSMPAASSALKSEPSKTVNLKVRKAKFFNSGTNGETNKEGVMKFRVHFWTTVSELKDKIFNHPQGIPVNRQRIFAQNCELENNRTLESYNILYKGKNTVLLAEKRAMEGKDSFIEPYGDSCK